MSNLCKIDELLHNFFFKVSVVDLMTCFFFLFIVLNTLEA